LQDAECELSEAIENLPKVRADKIGLDRRAGYVYVDEEDLAIIAEEHNIRTLDYYGGFEYIKPNEGRTVLGRYTIFNSESSRVMDALDYYEENKDVENG
jgi:hypothetical protein